MRGAGRYGSVGSVMRCRLQSGKPRAERSWVTPGDEIQLSYINPSRSEPQRQSETSQRPLAGRLVAFVHHGPCDSRCHGNPTSSVCH
ncbi:hypothetical protein FKM82_028326 [Ascaphus truei]